MVRYTRRYTPCLSHTGNTGNTVGTKSAREEPSLGKGPFSHSLAKLTSGSFGISRPVSAGNCGRLRGLQELGLASGSRSGLLDNSGPM
ncbi:hypothetical protein HYQ46_003028 [Verticillium longisporum]|nr:hypothetical protein HYQ46_003028 [Verticillium longisporum]